MTFGQRLEHILDKKNMKQKDLAELAGVNQLTVSRYVHDARLPQMTVVIDICKALNISADYLLGLKESEEI